MGINRYIRIIKKILLDKNYRFLKKANLRWYDKLDDTSFLKRKFRAIMGRDLNLDTPETFNEKLQWLKLNDRRPKYTMMVDKYAVRGYIDDTIGKELLVPMLGVWEDPDEIDFDVLPDQFVLKCTHNSGLGMCICKDKSILDVKAVKKGLRKGLKQNYYLTGREWPYKDVKPRIVCEKYLKDKHEAELKDYKLMCFNGKVKCTFVCSNRNAPTGLNIDVYDTNWRLMPVERLGHPNSKTGIPKPENYDIMIRLAEKLSSDIPFLRVDFYEVNGKVYFSELTFFPASGFEKFEPDFYDDLFGSWLDLPTLGDITMK